jgi:hypothetical protein
METARRTAVWAAALIALLSIRSAGAQVEGDRFESQEWGIRISAPIHWRMSAQTSYPSVLLWMHRINPPGKMLLSAERLAGQSTSVQYAERIKEQLTDRGYQVRKPQLHAATGAFWIEFDDGKTFFRQALLVSGDIGYALTLAASGEHTRSQHLRAFDYALRSIEKIDIAPEADQSAGTPAPDADCPAPSTAPPSTPDDR